MATDDDVLHVAVLGVGGVGGYFGGRLAAAVAGGREPGWAVQPTEPWLHAAGREGCVAASASAPSPSCGTGRGGCIRTGA